MTTAQFPNGDALRKGLAIYRDEMSVFIVRILRQKQGSRLEQTVANSLTDRQRQDFQENLRENSGNVEQSIEIGFIPNLVERNWPDLFQHQFAKSATTRNLLRTVRDMRNDLSHDTTGQDIPADKAEADLYFISDALTRINCPASAQEVLDVRSQIRGPAPVQPSQMELSSSEFNAEPEHRNGHSLKPWRNVMRPKEDVAEGSFLEADFAADIQEVVLGTAPAMYGDPLEFFRCTYITSGMRDLLVTATRRINGKGGNPIIQTKTGFGGGKTHSLIALYHLINSTDELLNAADGAQPAGIRDIHNILSDAGVDAEQRAEAKVCVLQCAWLSPTSSRTTDSGDPLNTLWGEMAYQLGGQAAYETVGTAARRGYRTWGRGTGQPFQHGGPMRHPNG